jgi:uncharacterized membrane protein
MMEMMRYSDAIVAILGMAGVTAFARVIGYWAIGKMKVSGPMAGALDAMPGAILIAIVSPAAFSAGPAEAASALLTVFLAWRFPMLVAVIGGVACVVILRFALS